MDLQYTDRIRVGLVTESAGLRAAAEQFADYICSETLAIELRFEPMPGVEPLEIVVGDHKALLYVQRNT